MNGKKTKNFVKQKIRKPIFPIVGISGSNGSLEAAKDFFSNVPHKCGIAFVFVQHRDTVEQGLIDVHIAKYTSMPVKIVADGTPIKPDQIYIIPPLSKVVIKNDHFLTIASTVNPENTKRPIDTFFKSLAKNNGDKSGCVILSGSSDSGILGLKAIKRHRGLTAVQTPNSAKYEKMPQSAINSGLIDHIDISHKLPSILINYFNQKLKQTKPSILHQLKNLESKLDDILSILNQRVNCDLSLYKKQTIIRRIQKRMLINQLDNIDKYICLLKNDYDEADLLFKDILIGVTCFFRDPEFYNCIQQDILPKFFSKHSQGKKIRIWVAGCSSGEEAYSITMSMVHYMHENKILCPLQVIATDINEDSIRIARRAWYPLSIESQVPSDYLKNYFIKLNNGYVVNNLIRQKLVFAIHDITKDPFYSAIDIILCRNLLIYFEPELQKKILPHFNYSLNHSGILCLGPAESICKMSNLYKVLDNKWKIFQTAHQVPSAELNTNNGKFNKFTAKEGEFINDQTSIFKTIVEGALLDFYAPVSVLINEDCNIFYIHGKIEPYLQSSTNTEYLNIINIIHDNIKEILYKTIHEAIENNQCAFKNNISLSEVQNEQSLQIIVQPISEYKKRPNLLLIIFQATRSNISNPTQIQVVDTQKNDTNTIRLNNGIKLNAKDCQSIIKELEMSNAKLRDTNNQLNLINHQLQQSNEELEVSREETQSINEELVTVNSELNNSILKCVRSNDDMNNLLECVPAATIFVDNEGVIRRYNKLADNIFFCKPETRELSFREGTKFLTYNNLIPSIREVINSLIPKNIEISCKNKLSCYNINIIPYLTSNNIVDGAVITAIDVTRYKEQLYCAQYIVPAIEQLPSSIIITDLFGTIEYVNQRFCFISEYSTEELIGKNINIIGSGRHPTEYYQSIWNTIKNDKVWHGELINRKKNNQLYKKHVCISAIKNNSSDITGFILIGNIINNYSLIDIPTHE